MSIHTHTNINRDTELKKSVMTVSYSLAISVTWSSGKKQKDPET